MAQALTHVPKDCSSAVIQNSPYVKRLNLVGDKAQIDGWFVHIRIHESVERDLYCTLIRRKFIPPLMTTYQDVVVVSKVQAQTEDNGP